MFLYFVLLNGLDFSFKYIILEQAHLHLIDIGVTVVNLVTVFAQYLCSIFHLHLPRLPQEDEKSTDFTSKEICEQ